MCIRDSTHTEFSIRFKVQFVKKKKVWKLRKRGRWSVTFCVWQSVFVTSWTRPARLAEAYLKSWGRPFFCSSLVKSKQTWLRPEELKFEGKKYFHEKCLHRTPVQSLQIETLAYFTHLQPSSSLRLEPSLITERKKEGKNLSLGLSPFNNGKKEGREQTWVFGPNPL